MTRNPAALLRPVQDLIDALYEGDSTRDEAQADSLSRWLAITPVRLLPAYEDVIRKHVRWGWQYGEPAAAGSSEKQAMQRALALLRQLAPSALMTALASFHASGYLREAALRRLRECTDGSEVPFLILRCNDWVRPVAELAQQALRERLRPAYATHLLHSYALLPPLVLARRNDLSILHRDVCALLRSPACVSALLAACHDDDREVRRGAYQLAADALAAAGDEDGAGLRRLLLQALASQDLWLRIWAARLARRRLYGSALTSVLQTAGRDRSVPVRREALLALIDDHPELAKSLLDPCASLRSMVRFYLRKKATLPFAAFYRQALDAALAVDSQGPSSDSLRQVCIALDGLGETAGSERAGPQDSSRSDAGRHRGSDSDDAALARTLLYDPRPRVRRSALRALVRMDSHAEKTASRGLLEAALRDPSPSVFRTALTLLTSEVGGAVLFHVGAEALWQCFDQRSEASTRRALLRALEHFARWTRLGYLLRACVSDDDRLAQEAQTACQRALSAQIYTGPSASERARIDQALTLLPDTAALRGLRRDVRAALGA